MLKYSICSHNFHNFVSHQLLKKQLLFRRKERKEGTSIPFHLCETVRTIGKFEKWFVNLVAPEQVGFEAGHLLILHQHAEGAPGAGEGRHVDCLVATTRVTSVKSQSQMKLTTQIFHYLLVPVFNLQKIHLVFAAKVRSSHVSTTFAFVKKGFVNM